jgi:hypothetical protein
MEPVLLFFGSTATILPYACDYFTFILLGTPFIMSCFTMNNLMRHQGNAMLSMLGIMTGAALNVVLDPIFIFGLGLGVKGAGMATALSQVVSFTLMLMLSGKRGGVPIRLSQFKPSMQRYRDIAAGGLPSLARQSMMGISALILNHVAGIYGDSAIASFSVVSRITMLASAAMIVLVFHLQKRQLTRHIRSHPHLHPAGMLVVMYHIHVVVIRIIIRCQIRNDTLLQRFLHKIFVLHQLQQLYQLRLARHVLRVEPVHQFDARHLLQGDGIHRIQKLSDVLISFAH